MIHLLRSWFAIGRALKPFEKLAREKAPIWEAHEEIRLLKEIVRDEREARRDFEKAMIQFMKADSNAWDAMKSYVKGHHKEHETITSRLAALESEPASTPEKTYMQ